jgi:hypothetical protein
LLEVREVEGGDGFGRRALGDSEVVEAGLSGAVAAFGEVEDRRFGGAGPLVLDVLEVSGEACSSVPAGDSYEEFVAVQ